VCCRVLQCVAVWCRVLLCLICHKCGKTHELRWLKREMPVKNRVTWLFHVWCDSFMCGAIFMTKFVSLCTCDRILSCGRERTISMHIYIYIRENKKERNWNSCDMTLSCGRERYIYTRVSIHIRENRRGRNWNSCDMTLSRGIYIYMTRFVSFCAFSLRGNMYPCMYICMWVCMHTHENVWIYMYEYTYMSLYVWHDSIVTRSWLVCDSFVTRVWLVRVPGCFEGQYVCMHVYIIHVCIYVYAYTCRRIDAHVCRQYWYIYSYISLCIYSYI